MAIAQLSDLDFAQKEVLVRVDFNVPLDDQQQITDDTRIQAALPTLRELLEKKAKLVLCSHLGRPKGEVVEKYSLRPAAQRLGELLGMEVKFAADCVGAEAAELRAGLQPGEVLLLENTRFYAGEEKNDPELAQKLAGQAEVFVNDAFGTCHRAHASTEGVTHHIPAVGMGKLVARELQYLQGELENPQRPFLVLLGGAKVSDKIEVITALLDKADTLLIGGAMAYTFRKAQGHQIGKSLVEDDKLELARDILRLAEEKKVRLVLPADSRITQEFKDGAETKVTAPYEQGGEIPADWEGIDIGDQAIEEFRAEIAQAKTVVWNGPMGVFEIPTFAVGTKAVAQALADSGALSIVGGGDSVTAINQLGLEDKMTFISTGGGASLELLEGKTLPAVAALDR